MLRLVLMIWLQQPSSIAPSSLVPLSSSFLTTGPRVRGILTRHLAGGIKIQNYIIIRRLFADPTTYQQKTII
jgi:hypothetical protein